MRKILAAFIVIAFAGILPTAAMAATSQSIVITISISSPVSVYVDNLTWDLTASSFDTSYTSSKYLVMNDGAVNETFKVQGANSSTGNWTMAASTGTNQFAVEALIGDETAVAPANSNFDASDILTAGSYIAASGTTSTLADSGWSATYGYDVAPTATRSMYLRFRMPTSGYTSQAQIGSVTILISADSL